MPFYYEQRGAKGDWTPVVQPQAPALDVMGREKRADGFGKAIRPGSIKEVAVEHWSWPLDALQRHYSQDQVPTNE